MSYRQNAAANRDALFGSAPSKPRSNKPKARNVTSTKNPSRALPSSGTTYQRKTFGATSDSMNSGNSSGNTYTYVNRFAVNKKSMLISNLTGAAKANKMKEAEDFRLQAKKALTRGVFSKPNPVIAGTYYKRAADAYKVCGENRLERLHRIASADCQRGHEAYAIAASEYTRAAELVEISDEKVGRKRNESYQLHKNAAEAYKEINEIARCGESLLRAAMGLLIEAHPDDSDMMDKKFLTILSEAIEVFMPDPINRFRSYRKYGTTLYKAEDNNFATIEAKRKLAYENIVSSPYTHETISKVVYTLVDFGEFRTALYAAGAVSALLEHEKTATISLSRSYLNETILQLAMKDIVAANNTFVEVHLQVNSYLRSRECKLAEELIRAMRTMDIDSWDKVKEDNKYALVNLDPSMRNLILNMLMTGVPRRVNSNAPRKTQSTISSNSAATGNKPSTSTPSTSPDFAADAQNPSSTTKDNFEEMMNIMDEMGLGDNDHALEELSMPDEDSIQPERTQEVEEEDDDLIDLR